MNLKRRQGWLRIAAKSLYPTIAVVAFFLGGYLLGGDGDSPASNNASDSHAHSQAKAADWTCSMDPQVHADKPGDCPICGMDLILSGATNDSSSGSDKVIEVTLSPESVARAGIRSELVVTKQFKGLERRLLGRVDFDDDRMYWVKSWVDGKVDRLSIGTAGQLMRKGQLVATVSSEEIRSIHQELLSAKTEFTELTGTTEIEKAKSEAALEAVRSRLRLLGCQQGTLDEMESAAKASPSVRLRSPYSGTLFKRTVAQGQLVTPQTDLFQIADLSRVWLEVDAYQSDLALLRVGQRVAVIAEKIPDFVYKGSVVFIDPLQNDRIGTRSVRIEVANSDGRLKPGTSAEVVVSAQSISDLEGEVVIPDTAPLFTGRRSIVYVEKPNTERPTYEARVVRLGEREDGLYPVKAGLSAGERVVVQGTFVIDSDLQIKGGESMIAIGDDREEGPFEHMVFLPEETRQSLTSIVADYLLLAHQLSKDEFQAAVQTSSKIVITAKAVPTGSSEEFDDIWVPMSRELIRTGLRGAASKEISYLRSSFRDISRQITRLLRVFGNPHGTALYLAYCPMALDGEGAEWIAPTEEIANPYFGASMFRCGEVRQSAPAGKHLPLEEVRGE